MSFTVVLSVGFCPVVVVNWNYSPFLWIELQHKLNQMNLDEKLNKIRNVTLATNWNKMFKLKLQRNKNSILKTYKNDKHIKMAWIKMKTGNIN